MNQITAMSVMHSIPIKFLGAPVRSAAGRMGHERNQYYLEACPERHVDLPRSQPGHMQTKGKKVMYYTRISRVSSGTVPYSVSKQISDLIDYQN